MLGYRKAKPGMADWLSIFINVVYLVLGIAGFAFSLTTVSNCEFVEWKRDTVPPGLEDEFPQNLFNISVAYVGMFRYEPDFLGCRRITDDFENDNFSGAFVTARVGNAVGVIAGGIAIIMMLSDFLCCRFPCSRFLITIFYLIAFVGQALTFLIYIAPLCDPGYTNGPYPCEPARGTWISTIACALFFIVGLVSCCVPKPAPMYGRVRDRVSADEIDPFCLLCLSDEEIEERRKAMEEEEKHWWQRADKEKEKPEPEPTPPPVLLGGAIFGKDGKEIEEEEDPFADQKAQAMITTTLADARRGKQEEIEKQLEMLSKYKDKCNISEEEYDEKVTKLIAALPSPTTFDECTRTTCLAGEEAPVVEEAEEEEVWVDEESDEDEERGLLEEQEKAGGEEEEAAGIEKDISGEGEEVYLDEDEEKKNFVGKAGAAMAAPFTYVGKKLKKKPPPEGGYEA